MLTSDSTKACAPVYFDRNGDALAPTKCLEATTETQWLRVALKPEPLLIRGPVVEKARLFYGGRDRMCVALQSPTLALQGLGLEKESIAWIRAHWGDEFETRFSQLPQPLRPAALLAALFPATGVPWFAAPTRESAARWLEWLAESDIPEIAPLLRAQAGQWQGQASDEIAPLFASTDAEGAKTFLSAWLALEARPRDFPASAGEFPIEVSTNWKERARKRWLSDLAGRGAAAWKELCARPTLGSALRAVAAEATATYLCRHPQQINAELLASLQPHLATETIAQLHNLVPPAAPEPLEIDASADAVLLWFEKQYWPFRRWQSALQKESAHYSQAQSTARTAARAFADWFLRFYSRALASGTGAEHLAGRRLGQWRAEHSGGKLTLLVIVDGLHAGDARVLLERLSKSKRLQLLNESPAFTAIPTITEIAKPALWWGLPPREAAPLTAKTGAFESAETGAGGTRSFDWPDGQGVGRELKEHADVSVLSAAQAGEVWMWNVLKLDSTYHKNYPPATTQSEAATVINGLAERIAAACEAVPEHLALRVIISADHGRLPVSSARSHPVPKGCAGHGRAALVCDASATSPIAFTGRDFIWESDGGGERVWLNPQRFGLSAPAVVCADENAFEVVSGAKTEHFSHGGLWPEEVIVPWMVLARDAATAHVEITLSGRAKAGAVGTLKLEARNAGEMNLIVQEVRARFGPRPQDERVVGVSQAVPALDVLVHTLALERWPDGESAARCEAIVVLARPDGSRFEVAAAVELESEELYRASNILDDFD